MEEKNNKFEYNYSAPTANERREIESIRQAYLPKEERTSKLERLKTLDRRVKSIPMCVGLTIGIVGTLIFGLGLSMILVWEMLVGGIILMLPGSIVAILAYPIFKFTLKRMTSKHKEEIIKLSAELLNENNIEP